MKLKNYWKRFWTLDRHHAAGFTLVELIVVIAILAILAGVGIPVYSGYITKANMQADMTLISEVENALTLGYYANSILDGGYVVLQYDAAPVISGDLDAAMEAVFGAGWKTNETLQLKHNGWNPVSESTFADNQTVLTNHVATLTDILQNNIVAHPELLQGRGGFESYMTDTLKFDANAMNTPEKVADAAVLYIADTTTRVNQEDFTAAIEGSYGELGAMFTNLIPVYGGSYVQAAAASYAMMIGYVQSQDKATGSNFMADVEDKMKKIETDISVESSETDVFNAILNPLQEVIMSMPKGDGGVPVGMQDYWENQIGKDATAFIDMMGTITDSKNVFVDNLGNSNCYNSDEVRELFAAYTNGGVVINIDSDGVVTNNLE